MRRIGLCALFVSALSSTAFSQSLQVIYSPYGASQPAYVAQQAPAQVYQQYPAQQYPAQQAQQYYVYPAQAPQPRYVVTRPQGVAQPQYAAAPPQYPTTQPQYPTAQPQYAAAVQPAPAPAPSNGSRGIFSDIFGGPTIQVPVAHLFSPAPVPQQQYQPAAVAPEPAVLTPASYAPAGGRTQDMSTYPIDPKFDRQMVAYNGDEKPGTVVVDTPNKFLYLVEDGGKAMRYGIGVGRPGFTWSGVHTVTAKKEWPDWTPPPEMLQRRPDLPRFMPGGMDNPLGARALYLGSTLYRIHGSNEPWTIGTNVSSGCIRMRNADVEDLYNRVKVGTKVVVL